MPTQVTRKNDESLGVYSDIADSSIPWLDFVTVEREVGDAEKKDSPKWSRVVVNLNSDHDDFVSISDSMKRIAHELSDRGFASMISAMTGKPIDSVPGLNMLLDRYSLSDAGPYSDRVPDERAHHVNTSIVFESMSDQDILAALGKTELSKSLIETIRSELAHYRSLEAEGR